jgi:uncharacterized protein (TIGR00251 family)
MAIVSSQQGIRLTIHVVPNAKQTLIALERDGSLTMRVHAAPVKGKANREIVKFLSKKLGIPSSKIQILAGVRSNVKTIEIIGMNERNFLDALGGESQSDLRRRVEDEEDTAPR